MTREEQIKLIAFETSSNDYPISEYEGFVRGAKWADEHPKNLWHDAQGDDLPPIDKEVIVLLDNGKVCFGHRPVESFTGISITNHSEMEEYYPERYGKGGWNIPDVKWWLDVSIPNMEEEK